ncbi:MAG: sugar ABC transporter permease [Chloroflexota bacterium]|nr:MAG: sugar ABC transporter permease [Chloroflexota bacterium]
MAVRSRGLTLGQRRMVWAYIFLFVPLVFFISIRVAPTLFAMSVSLFQWDILSPEKPWMGLENYRNLFHDDVFWKALTNTLLYVALSVPLALVFGLSVALLLQRAIHWKGFFRALYFIPFVTSTVAISWVWRWMYEPTFGPLNKLLALLGLPEQTFLANPDQALPSIVVAITWQAVGFYIIIFLAGLEAIPSDFYDAAKIDGADGWNLFRHITLPLLNPTIVFLTVIGTITGIQVFTQVLNMSYQGMGGPLNSTKSLVLFIYQQAFQSFKMGYAAAGTVVLFAIILLITLIQLRVTSRRVEY